MRRMLSVTGVIAVLITAIVMIVGPVMAQDITNPAFQRVWNRQDLPVAQQISGRSWTWGPEANTDSMREPYAESPEGQRVVQYFDKSRMEITDPTADQNSQWYVTNGLLPIELMSGNLQVGNEQFEFRSPARISAIGDPGHFPTYADLARLYPAPPVNPNDLGRPATGLLTPDGSVGAFDEYADDPKTVLVQGENNQGVAQAFIDFQNQQGVVYENGNYAQGQVYNPLFVFGKPVTGAFWVETMVGGEEQTVLFQVFERRVLTYNPENEEAFQVEMGNVGQHYYQWRYEGNPEPYPAP